MPTYKLTLRSLLQTGLTLCLFLMPVAAMAQGMTFPSGMQESIASITVYIVSALNLLTWVFFIYLTILLDPEFIFNTQNSTAFEDVLNSIWILSRDLMNIAFAFALIGAAVYTIVTAKKEFVASHLKTFVMAVILVNFSWFIPRVIIDVGNVAAASIYGIPTLLQNQGVAQECTFTTNKDMRPNVSCDVIEPEPPANPDDPVPPTRYSCQCAMLANAKFFMKDTDARDLERVGWDCVLGKTMCLHFVNLDVNSVSGHSAILNGLIVNHARLQGLASVPPGQRGSEVGAIITFLLQQLMVLVIHIALFFPLAAMTAAFAIRIPVLWITVAFMPFAMLKFVLPGNFAEYPQKIWSYFLQAAFLPAIVAIPLAIGFILVNAGSQLISAAPVLSGIGTIDFKITDSVSDLFQLLWLGLTLAVLYLGVFMALGKVEFAAGAANFIKGIGSSLGAVAVKLPLSLPVIPGPGGGRTPLQLLKNIDPRSVSYKLSNDPRGLAGVLSDIQTGNTNGGPFGGAATAAKQIAEMKNTDAIVRLNAKIAEMTQHISGGGKPDFERFAREIRDDLKINIDVDKNNPETSLRTFAAELSKHPAIDKTHVTGLNNALDSLRAAMANPPPPKP